MHIIQLIYTHQVSALTKTTANVKWKKLRKNLHWQMMGNSKKWEGIKEKEAKIDCALGKWLRYFYCDANTVNMVSCFCVNVHNWYNCSLAIRKKISLTAWFSVPSLFIYRILCAMPVLPLCCSSFLSSFCVRINIIFTFFSSFIFLYRRFLFLFAIIIGHEFLIITKWWSRSEHSRGI